MNGYGCFNFGTAEPTTAVDWVLEAEPDYVA